MEDAKDLLGQTLDEEKEADEKLAQIARQINPEAEQGEESEQEEGEMAMAGARSKSSRSSGGSKSSNSRAKKR